MKIASVVFGILLLASCNNNGGNVDTTDSVTINTTESNKADGGPNNGLGDTNTLNPGRDTTRQRFVK